ncbi:hypothetical protein Ahy_B10g104847 [Arachis hypogaea]|uniref:Transcriptional regulatory protein n=1 Tax=Arachis hypogaea TaxID=3818 RepID=A0A444X6K2_ARAHY|nr:hypothetical protein Ahy_B10g104847 [Arachis hypogaea]
MIAFRAVLHLQTLPIRVSSTRPASLFLHPHKACRSYRHRRCHCRHLWKPQLSPMATYHSGGYPLFLPFAWAGAPPKSLAESVKKGGPNVTSNPLLAAILEKAKELDVPKDIVERNIKRASEKGQEAYIEKVYEVYGYGGVSMVVEVSTDKVHRSVAKIREVVKDCGGKMADSGSVTFKFRRVRVVNIKVTDADKDQLLSIALDAGAEDVIEPSTYEDDTEEDRSERYYKIVGSSDNYATILSKLREEGINFEPDNGSELLPNATIEVDDEAMDLNKELMNKLLELDDVDAVYTDQK